MAIDQITLDILWSRLIATTNDQAAALMRSSFTSIVRESGDLSAGVFDRRGRMIAQAVTGTPGHINSMATGMTHFLRRFPVDTLEPGDVLITNDPWKTASQLNDITIATPVFRNGRCIALFANCCHALDIGGRGLSADSRSVFEEGMFIPVMKLIDRREAGGGLLRAAPGQRANARGGPGRHPQPGRGQRGGSDAASVVPRRVRPGGPGGARGRDRRAVGGGDARAHSRAVPTGAIRTSSPSTGSRIRWS